MQVKLVLFCQFTIVHFDDFSQIYFRVVMQV